MNIPIIKLEIESMKHTIMQALPQHADTLSASVRTAVEAFCTPENIDAIISQTVSEIMNTAVKDEVRSFFQYSRPGRQAIREAVMQYLTKWENDRRTYEEARDGD